MNAFKSLSKRDRSFAIAIVALIAAYLFYQFLAQPFLAQREALSADRAATNQQLADADQLFSRRNALKNVWSEIKDGGLKSNRSQADSQAQQAVLDWAKSAGVNVASIKPERDVEQNQFQVISFHVTGNGTMLSIANMLWSLETATIPVRVTELQIQPRKEGADDLILQMTVSTLSLPPDSGKTAVSMADEGSVGR